MFDSKKLSEDDIQQIKNWASQGADLQEIQKRVTSELGHNITYLDTRFLILDLDIILVEEPDSPSSEDVQETAHEEDDQHLAPEPITDTELTDEITDIPETPSNVQVSLDDIALPGTLMSGKVQFSDGQKGRWYLDQTGRLGIDPDLSGYQPTPDDLDLFRDELMKIAR